MPKTLIVAFDNWQSADAAVHHAAALAGHLSARVILLGIMPGTEGESGDEFVDPVLWSVTRSEFEARLNQYVEQFTQHHIEATVEIIKTPWVESLFQYADSQSCDLMIVPIGDENLSAIIQSILKHTHIPVLLARSSGLEPTFKNILVPLDGSQRAESSLNLAASIAQATGAQLHLAHVVQKPEMPRRTTASAGDMEIAEQLIQRNAIEVKRYLHQVAARPGVNAKTHVVIGNTVTTSLHNLIQQYGIDMIVLSAHGFSGEPQWSFGTIAENLIRYARVPTLVVQDLPVLTNRPPAETMRTPTGAAR
jgi:nucleotide-binding universal stress UspA family protein